MSREFPRLTAAIENGISRQLHTGVQVYVSVGEDMLLNAGFGTANRERPLDAEAIMLWRSAGKPVTAAAILKLIEQGPLSLSSTVQDCLPEAGDAVGGVTVRELLTHASGLPLLETGWPTSRWDETLQRVLVAGPLDRSAAAYQPQSTWFLLGEILRRHVANSANSANTAPEHGAANPPADNLAAANLAAANPVDAALRTVLLAAADLEEVWCGMPEQLWDSPNLPAYFERQRGQLIDSDYSGRAWLTAPSPGGNLRGPIRVLGEFYQMLMRGGLTATGTRVLSTATVEQMTHRHRVDRYDETLQHVIDFGLGVIVNSNHHGIDTVPYGFSRYSSRDSFGHGGAQCSMGFCDPHHQLVVAWAANAFCGEGQHQRRNRAINEAIYEDLGLAQTSV